MQPTLNLVLDLNLDTLRTAKIETRQPGAVTIFESQVRLGSACFQRDVRASRYAGHQEAARLVIS
jgi:hypothetical protein